MNKFKTITFLRLIGCFFLVGCIETDIQDPLPPTIRIIPPNETKALLVSEKYKLEAEYTDDSGEINMEAKITWESSDPTILMIDKDSATGVSPGEVMVTASFQNIRISELFTVSRGKKSIAITHFVRTLVVGGTSTFKVTYRDVEGEIESITPNWSSSDESVATVDTEGLVTAVGVGSTDISSAYSSVSDVKTLMVTNSPVMVDPAVRIISMIECIRVGESFQFGAQYYDSDDMPDNSVGISWESSNMGVITIDQGTGLASAVMEGMAIITASSDGGVSATTNIRVEPVLVSATRTGTLEGNGYDISGSFTLERNDSGDLILTVEDYVSDGPGPYFYFSNHNRNVNNGLKLKKASKRGEHTINVTEIDGSVELSTYRYLVVWCKPFGVTLGSGEFNN